MKRPGMEWEGGFQSAFSPAVAEGKSPPRSGSPAFTFLSVGLAGRLMGASTGRPKGVMVTHGNRIHNLASNGSQPARKETLERFAEKFGAVGFTRSTHYPCYGMEDATLFTTDGEAGHLPVKRDRIGHNYLAHRFHTALKRVGKVPEVLRIAYSEAVATVVLTSCILALSLLPRPASGGDFYRPRYLVEGQLVPYAIKATVSGAPGDADHRLMGADANLIPILNGQNALATLGGGYYHETFTERETSRHASRQLTAAYGSLFATGDFAKKWYWIAYHLYGAFGNSLGDSWGNQDRWLSMGGAGYKLSPNLSFGALLLYSSNFGESLFLPMPMVSYSAGRFFASIAPPGQLEVRFDWSDRFHTLASARFPAYSFYIPKEDVVLTWSALDLEAAAEFKVFRWTYLQTSVNWLPWNEISWREDVYPATGFSQSVRASLSILLVVD